MADCCCMRFHVFHVMYVWSPQQTSVPLTVHLAGLYCGVSASPYYEYETNRLLNDLNILHNCFASHIHHMKNKFIYYRTPRCYRRYICILKLQVDLAVLRGRCQIQNTMDLYNFGKNFLSTTKSEICIYITNLVCYTYFHWFFSPECQHIFGKQTGYIFQSPKTIKTWTTKH
jgi:hypothetical protein